MQYKYICKIWKEAMKHTAPHKYQDYKSCTCKVECNFKLNILKFDNKLIKNIKETIEGTKN